MDSYEFYKQKEKKILRVKKNIKALELESLNIDNSELLKNIVALGDFFELIQICCNIKQILREINEYGLGSSRVDAMAKHTILPVGMFTAWKLAREKDNLENVVICKLHVYSDSDRSADNTTPNLIHVDHSKITNIYEFDKSTKELTNEINSSQIQLVSFFENGDLVINKPYYGESYCCIDLGWLIENLITE